MRTFLFGLLCAASIGCGTHYIADLPLVWAGVDKTPASTTAVGNAFNAVPVTLGDLKDARPGDKSRVGTYEDDGFVVTTKGDVAAFWRGRLRAMLEGAGARIDNAPQARIDAELLQFDVVEGNTFNGVARMRVSVLRPGAEAWSKTYEGRSKRWGRSHKEENFNEALSSALADATRKLVQDEAFAKALLGQPQTTAAPTSSH